MSDYSQSVVFPSVGEEEAERLSNDLLAWLVSQNVLTSAPSDCVLGSSLGYRPGSNYVVATGEPDEVLLQLWTNGAEFSNKRTVFDAGGNGFSLACRSCGVAFGNLPRWGDAVNEWLSSAGEGHLTCPACAAARPVEEWLYDPPYGFASLGITFWNWPSLNEGFVQELSARVGHLAYVIHARV